MAVKLWVQNTGYKYRCYLKLVALLMVKNVTLERNVALGRVFRLHGKVVDSITLCTEAFFTVKMSYFHSTSANEDKYGLPLDDFH